MLLEVLAGWYAEDINTAAAGQPAHTQRAVVALHHASHPACKRDPPAHQQLLPVQVRCLELAPFMPVWPSSFAVHIPAFFLCMCGNLRQFAIR